MTHVQWICRNFSKHHHAQGTLEVKTRKEIHAVIKDHLNQGMDTIPKESWCLLEIDPQDLIQMQMEGQQYWLNVINVAKTASVEVLGLTHAHGATAAGRK